jgi:hypothetical protein
LQIVANKPAETCELEFELVGPAWQLLEAIGAVCSGGLDPLADLQRGARERHGDARQRAARIILDNAVNRARRSALRRCRQPVLKVWRRTETSEAPRRQGATSENTGSI